MTEEEIKALQEELEAAKAAAAQAKAEAEKAKGDVQKVVDELTEERRKKQEAERKAAITNGEPDIEALIDQAIKSREEKTREQEFKSALEEFRASKHEFQADAAGLVFSKFEDQLKRFNFSDIQSKEQMKARLEEVYRFMNFKPNGDEGLEYEGSPSNPFNVDGPRQETPREVKSVLEMTGMEQDKFKDLKTKYPEALESLGL